MNLKESSAMLLTFCEFLKKAIAQTKALWYIKCVYHFPARQG